MKLLLTGTVIVICASAPAIASGFPGPSHIGNQAHAAFGPIAPIHWIEGSERIESTEYPAVGTIECNGLTAGSASVVGRRDIIVTAAHVFFDLGNKCAERRNCEFVTSVNGKTVRRGIASSPKKVDSCPVRSHEDWDVAVLGSPVPQKIEPLAIGETAKGDSMLAMNGNNIDVNKDARGDLILDEHGNILGAKTKAPCQNLGMGEHAYGGLLMTNCSASSGASGSPLLNSSHETVAVAVQVTEKEAEILARFNAGNFDAKRCKFDPQTCATYYRLIDGDFLRELKSAIIASHN